MRSDRILSLIERGEMAMREVTIGTRAWLRKERFGQ
jgi:hypothetical protein